MPEWEDNPCLPSTRNQEVNGEDVSGDLYQYRPPPPPSPSTESSDGDASEGNENNEASPTNNKNSVLASDNLHKDCPLPPPSPSTESSDGDERDCNKHVIQKGSKNLELPPGQLHQHRPPPPPSPSTEASDGDADEIGGNKSTSQISDDRLAVPPGCLHQYRPPPPPSPSTESSHGDSNGDDSEDVNQRSGESSAAPLGHLYQHCPPPPPSPSTDSSDREPDDGEGGKNARERDGERPTAPADDLHQHRPPPQSSLSTESGKGADRTEDGTNTLQGGGGKPAASTSRPDSDNSKVWNNGKKDAEVNVSKLLTKPLSADNQGLEAITAESPSMIAAADAIVLRPVSTPAVAPVSAVENSRPQQLTAEALQPRLPSSTRKSGRSLISEPLRSDSVAPLPPPSPASIQGRQNPSQTRKRGPIWNTRSISEEGTHRTLAQRNPSMSSHCRTGSSRKGNSFGEEDAKLAEAARLSRVCRGYQPEPKRASSSLVTPTVQTDHFPDSNGSPRGEKEAVLREVTRPAGSTQSRKHTSSDTPEDIAVAALNALSGFTPPPPSPPSLPSELATNDEPGVSSARAPTSLSQGRNENRTNASAAGRSSPTGFVFSSPLAERTTARVSEGRTDSTSCLPRPAAGSCLLDAATGEASASSSPTSSGATVTEIVSGRRASGQLGDSIAGSDSLACHGVSRREVSESPSTSGGRGERYGIAGDSGEGHTHEAPANSVTMPSPVPRQATSPLLPSDATTGTASGRTVAAIGNMGDSCQRQGKPSRSGQRRGRTSATCSEAPQGAPRNKRARIQTLSPTSAPVSDESGNVTLDGPRERGNGDSDSSDIEPSTTREEDLALIREREADHEGLLAIHAMIAREIVALQAEEDELRKLAGLPAVHPELAPSLRTPMLPLSSSQRKYRGKVSTAESNDVGAPTRAREADLSAEAPRLSPVNDTGPTESGGEMVGNDDPVPNCEGSSNASISCPVPLVRTCPGGSSRNPSRLSDMVDDNFNGKETLLGEIGDGFNGIPPAYTSPGGSSGDLPRHSDRCGDNTNGKGILSGETNDVNGVPPACSSPGGSSGDSLHQSDTGNDDSNEKGALSDKTDDDSNGGAQSKGKQHETYPVDGPKKSSESANAALSLGSGHDVSSSNVVLGSLPPLLPAPMVGILDDSPVSMSDGTSFDMEGLLLNDSDEDKDDKGGGESAQKTIGKESSSTAVRPLSDRSVDSGRAPAGGRGTGAGGGKGRGGERALTTLGARGRGRYGQGSGVRPAPSRGGANRPRYLDLNATYKRYDPRGGRGRLGERGGRRGSSTIASNRARGRGN